MTPPNLEEQLHAIGHTFFALKAAARANDYHLVAKLCDSVIEQAQLIETLACQHIGAESQRKEPLLCSLPLANSPSSQSLPPSSPPSS